MSLAPPNANRAWCNNSPRDVLVLYVKELGVGREEFICPDGVHHEEERPMRGLNASQMRSSNGRSNVPDSLS